MENLWAEGDSGGIISGWHLEESEHAKDSSLGFDGEIWSSLSCSHTGELSTKPVDIDL